MKLNPLRCNGLSFGVREALVRTRDSASHNRTLAAGRGARYGTLVLPAAPATTRSRPPLLAR
jgi:hypothetical protein